MRRTPLKRSRAGLEIEVELLDSDGMIANKAPEIMREAKRLNKDMFITKEYSKSWIELGAFPSVKVQNTAMDLLENLQTVIDVAAKHELAVHPLSIYPGKFTPKIVRSVYYDFMTKHVFKEGMSKYIGKTKAFHFHYALPKGVFDKQQRFLKIQRGSKIKDTLLGSYNLSIAMDPALITLFQSSPILDGEYVAKDTRALLQRNGRFLPYKGVFSRYPILAGLPPYKYTVSELNESIRKRFEKVRRIMERNKLNPNLASQYTRRLGWSFHSVRINKQGTMEQRTMDMNHPKYVIAGTVLMKYIHRKVQQEFLRVRPSETGIEEPFKLEGDLLHIPPSTYVRKILQKASIYEGFENKEIANYTKRLYSFGRRCTNKMYYRAIRPFQHMIDKKESVSDNIMRKLKKRGYGKEDTIPNDVCAEIALKSSSQLSSEIDKTKKMIVDLHQDA